MPWISRRRIWTSTFSLAAFAKPEIYEALEDRGVDYVIRIPANKKLEWEIADILFRPPERPSAKPLVCYKSFRYQAESWSKPRRIVAKVEHHLGELFARVGFIVTNMSLPSRSGYVSTTSAAPPSSGSKKANRRRTGHGCRAIASGRTKSACNSVCWPTTWVISGGG